MSALASLRDQRAAPAVAAVLRNAEEHPSVRQTAARVLGQLRHAESVNALMDVLRLPWPQGRDGDPEPWSDAQEAMRGLKQAATQGLLATPLSDLSRVALAAAIGDPDADLRAEAGRVLCYARSWPEAFELVAPLASDPDPEVRLALVTHVSQLGDPRGLDLIRVARTDEDARVRARGEDVLEWVDPRTETALPRRAATSMTRSASPQPTTAPKADKLQLTKSAAHAFSVSDAAPQPGHASQ